MRKKLRGKTYWIALFGLAAVQWVVYFLTWDKAIHWNYWVEEIPTFAMFAVILVKLYVELFEKGRK